ncbi:MAG: hypothetical protein HS108_02645 [Planctomycetes bacterium]|jgi:hypothetical protein|nr:hypothetical protein [Planctomycetota bacterium]MCL4729071.1 hypothetical protein [Planctomycetota bacterium]
MRATTQLTLALCLVLAGCGAENSIKQARPVCEQFLAHLSQEKFAQAHELCDPARIELDDLKAWAADAGNMSMLRDYQGVQWQSGGQYTAADSKEFDRPTVRTPPGSKLTGRPDVTVQFALRMDEGGKWVIIGFAIKSGQ